MVLVIFFLFQLSSFKAFADVGSGSSTSGAAPLSPQSSGISKSVETIVQPETPRASSLPHDQSVVQVSAGSGMKAIDSPLNEVGLELKNLEKSQDPSIERRGDVFWIKPEASSRWLGQSRLDLSLDQKFKARIMGQGFGQKLAFEGGFTRDHRPILYIDNHDAPYSGVGNTLGRFPNQKDGHFLKATVTGGERTPWEVVGDHDFRDEGVFNGAIWIGRRSLGQTSVNGKIQVDSFQIKPFFQARQSEFVSAIAPLTDNSTVGWKAGIQSEWRLNDRASVQAVGANDHLDRTLKDNSVASFSRFSGRLQSKVDQIKNEYCEWGAHLFFEGAQDQYSTNQSVSDFVWDGGLEISTLKSSSLGWIARTRRFAVLPSPLQRFGDGATLQAAPSLIPETGIRFSTGPWYKTKILTGQISFFSEESKNAPVLFVSGPGAIQTYALNGLWARGAELSGSFNLSPISYVSSLVYQDAVNHTDIRWERGKAIPGYPSWMTKNEIQYKKGRFQTGIRHRYRSTEALDLTGTWVRPPYHVWDSWLGYAEKKWEARLVLNNIFPNYNLPQNLQFPGSASTNLLEPTIQQREIRFVWELVI